MIHDPTKHTGRRFNAPTPWQALRRAVRGLLWPGYACECCVGQEYWQGCYCAYNEAIAPGFGPTLPYVWGRAVYRLFFAD